MTLLAPITANAPPVHFEREPFRVTAHAELQAYPFAPPGSCVNPDCARPFEATRGWQWFCSAACRRAHDAEMRRIGAQAAPMLLAHRLGKYETEETPLKALSRKGRNELSKLGTEWVRNRRQRADWAGKMRQDKGVGHG